MGSTSCKGKQRFWEFLFSIFTMGNATGSPTVKCFRFVCENLTIFPFGKRIVGKLDSTDRQLTGEHEGHFTISLYKRIRIVFQYSNSLFTQPTQTRQDSLVLSWPSFQFATFQSQIYWGLMKTSKLETGFRQYKTVSSCLQLRSHRRHGQDKSLALSVSAVWTSYKNSFLSTLMRLCITGPLSTNFGTLLFN